MRCWETGRNRVPWSAVRLLRLLRCGDLGGLCDEWDGWTINRLGLHSPEGRTYRVDDMRRWWAQIERARLWQEAYDRANPLRAETTGQVPQEPVRAFSPPSPSVSLDLKGRSPERLEGALTFLPAVAVRSVATRQETANPEPTWGEAQPRGPAFVVLHGVLPVECIALCREDASLAAWDFSHLRLAPSAAGFVPVKCEALCRDEARSLDAFAVPPLVRLVPTVNKGLKAPLWLHSDSKMQPQALTSVDPSIDSEATP